MKRLSFLASLALTAVLTFSTTLCSAQDSIQYQLVIRNSAGQLVTGKQVNMRFSLMSGEQTFYQETMPANTNQFGNINVMIGTGKAMKGSMKDVPWSTMDISLKVEADTEGGEKFAELGTVPIAAAPYAMYAATAGGNASNGSPKGDEALFEVCDRDGQPVFAVYNDGIVVYIDQNSADKAKRSGLVVTGRKATKDGETADYFSVTTEGTHIYVDEDDSNKAKRSGLIVHGRKATKDGDNTLNSYLTVDASGTHVFVDSAGDDKAKRSGLVVTGRKATKDGEPNKFLTIDANATQFYIDENDSDKAKRSGFVVTGRKATKDDDFDDNAYFAVTADGTNVIVDNDDDKAKRSVLVITGRKATKAGSEVFAVDGDLTHVYIDDDDAKAKRSGLVVTGRKATKDGIDYIDIDANRANLVSQSINISAPGDDAMAMQVSNDELFINNMAIDGELRRWLTLPSVDEPYKLEVTTDQTIENSELVDDIMGDHSSFVVMAELDEEKRCMPYINEQQTMAFDQNGELTYDIENAYVVVDFDYDLNIHPIKPCDNINIAFAMVNYEYTYSYGPNGWAQIPTVPINYREFNITIKAETIEPSIEVVAVTEQQEDNNNNWTYFGSAMVNGKECETDEWITSTDMVTYGSEVTLEAKADDGYIFVGWVAYSHIEDIYEGYGEIARYSENPLKIRATRNVYYLAQFKSLEEPLYVNHNNDHSEWCYGDDDSHNGTNGCEDALYSVEKALQILAGYNSPDANFTIDVTNYNEDFTIGSELNGKAATLTIKNSIFAYNTTGKVTINTTVPFGIESSYYGSTDEINASFAVGAGASLALKNVKVNSVELNATAQLFMVGAEVTEPVQLAEGQTITLYNIGNKATITPSKYEDGLPILTVPAEFGSDAAALLAAEAENFSVTQGALPQGYSADDGWHWIIGTDGKLALSDMITYEFDDYSLGTNTSNSRYFTKTKDELIEGRKYRFTVASGFTNLSGLCNMLYDGNLSSSYVNYYGGKHFGESILDLSNARSINHSNTNYVNSNLGSYYTTFDNNITTIILPYNTSISGQSNLFMNVQDALKEIKLATGNTYSGNGAISNGAFVYTIGSGSTAARYLYCYPSQREGTTYIIPNDVTALFDAAFYMNANLETIENLGQITQVGGYVFAESKKLKAVDLSGVTKFEVKGNSGKGSESPFLFRNSNVEKVTLPSWQFTIGEGWFDGCSNLEEVEFKGTTPPHLTNRYSLASQYSVSNHFNSINSNVVFRVPSGAVRNYIEPTGTGMDNGYAYYEFANTSGNYLFRNGTYYITDGTDIAVGVNRIAEAISNVNANGQTIIIGGSLADAQWQSLNTALANASFSITLDFSKQTIASFGTWLQNNTNLAGIVLPDNVTTIDAGAFSGCTNLNNINLDANDWYVTDNDGNPTSKVVLNNGQSFANYLQSCNSKLVKVQSTFYVQQGGNGNGSISNPLGSIQDAVDIIVAKNNSNIDYTINVKGTLSGAQTMNGTTLAENCSITLQGAIDNGSQQQPTLNGGFSDNNNGTTLTITTTMPVTIKNLKITGGYNYAGGGVVIGSLDDDESSFTREVTLGDNVLITGNYAKGGDGSYYNDGGGILLTGMAKLTIDGENTKITGNTSAGAGAGIAVGGEGYEGSGANRTLYLLSGEISNNISENYSGDEALYGGGGVSVYGSNSFFEMSGTNSVIKGNSGPFGGGVGVCFGSFEMSGGTIGAALGSTEGGNTATGTEYGRGGGVGVSDGSFTMSGNSYIRGNKAEQQIGQNNLSGTFYPQGGGGVCLSSSVFTMKNGYINGNEAVACGGGVYVDSQSIFDMQGGKIGAESNNAANPNKVTGAWPSGSPSNGNGVFVFAKGDNAGTFKISGNPMVASGNDVYLRQGVVISVEKTLSNSTAKVAYITPSVYSAGSTVVSGSSLSSSNYTRFEINPQSDGTEWVLNFDSQNKECTLAESPAYKFGSAIVPPTVGTDGSGGTTATYVWFGHYPRSVKAEGVEITSKTKQMGGLTYYLGNDNNWYVKHQVQGYGTFSDGTSFNGGYNVEKYFKVEPIKWRVLTTDYNGTGYALLMADSVIGGYTSYNSSTAVRFMYYKGYPDYTTEYNRNFEIDGVQETNIPSNNYKYSNMRAWLNGLDGSVYSVGNWSGRGFLQTAFTEEAQSKIMSVSVDNSAIQHFEPDMPVDESITVCDNTNDKVFLLSYREATNRYYGFAESNKINSFSKRQLYPTDYAMANNVQTNNGSAYWWLRSPQIANDGNYYNKTVSYQGGFQNAMADSYNTGIVPVICVDLSEFDLSIDGSKQGVDEETGALCGKFSVSETEQVQFSRGNLQYLVGTDKYRFAYNQYEYLGVLNRELYYAGGAREIDLFGWGSGNQPTANNNSVIYGPVITAETTGTTIIGTEYDWGHYPIINGGNTESQWFTLTKDQWDWLLNNRSDATDKRGVAKVCNINGLVLLPDNWTGDAIATEYNDAQWLEMEAAGAVFLPAGGYRNYTQTNADYIINMNVNGSYWTATPYYDEYYSDGQSGAYSMDINTSNSNVSTQTASRSMGYSVRLVKEANP